MKPLTLITTYNRWEYTEGTLKSIEGVLGQVDLVIVDNGSRDETNHKLLAWVNEMREKGYTPTLLMLNENMGCPRALNLALQRRKPGQPVIKLDNDVEVKGEPGWLYALSHLVSYWKTRERRIGMVGAYYEPWPMDRVTGQEIYEWQTLWHVNPVIGHAVYHSGSFMDEVGYFDVLTYDHLYGFEDLVMSKKAEILGYERVAWEGWEIRNLQRQSALGKEKDAHIRQMRPYYNARVGILENGGPVYTGPSGYPEARKPEKVSEIWEAL